MESIREAYHRYLRYFLSKDDSTATVHDRFVALAYAVRSEMVDRWIRTQEVYHARNVRRAYYLSTEYVLGKSLEQNLISLGLLDEVRRVAAELGFSLEEVFECEDDLELGNGAKGRESAALMESCATLGLPAMSYGLRYDYGLFRQRIVNGAQVEVPYDWQNREHPWEIPRPEYQSVVQFGGKSEPKRAAEKTAPHWWHGTLNVMAVPWDIPVPGHGRRTVNTLRLWASRPAEEFPADYGHHGDYIKACEDISEGARITRVLHPDSDVLRASPQRLRLQYFLVSASLQDIIRRYKVDNATMSDFGSKVAVHLSGSSCALAVPELMRLLVDGEEIPWAAAWDMTRSVFSVTSHAVAYNQVEIWPVYLVEQMLPRHLEIIYELNQQHLDGARALYGGNVEVIRQLSVIEEGEVRRVRMGNLAMLACRRMAAVDERQLHVLRTGVFPWLAETAGDTIEVVPSGVEHRRWLLGRNEPLAALLTEAIGPGWVHDPEELRRLEPLASDSAFLERYAGVKRQAKERLAAYLRQRVGITFDENAILDVVAKRFHPCKRQMLALLAIVARYLRLKAGDRPAHPRVHLFGGKAMPTDYLGRQTILLVNLVAEAIRNDPAARGLLQVEFVPDYGVSWADRIAPAADLAEELGGPGHEASTTTHYKMAFGGALILARRGGSADSLIAQVTEENVFAFGPAADPAGPYEPWSLINAQPRLREAFEWLERLASSRGGEAMPLISGLRDQDRYRVVADLEPYMEAQDRVDAARSEPERWRRMSLVTLARAGAFSADRSALAYARSLWKVEAVSL